MATCVKNNLDFGLDTDRYLSKEEIKLSRTEQFIKNFQTYEIWKTNELSPFISKLVKKINSVDEYLWNPKSDVYDSSFNLSENYGLGRDPDSSKQKLGTRNNKECNELFEVDYILRTNFPPYEHLDSDENKICNALYEDRRQEGSVWKDTVVRYNNSFDPRLAFKGLVPEKLLEQERCNSLDETHQPLTYNCYLNILNPSAFTNSFLKSHRLYNEELRKDNSVSYRSWKGTTSSVDVGTKSDKTEPVCDDEDESEIPKFVGENNEFIYLWSKISPTQMFWIREDYKWLDNCKPEMDKLEEKQKSNFDPQHVDSQQIDGSYMPQTSNQPAQVFSGTRQTGIPVGQVCRPTEVYPQTSLNSAPTQHLNQQTYQQQAYAYSTDVPQCSMEQRQYQHTQYMNGPETHSLRVDQNSQQPTWCNGDPANFSTHMHAQNDPTANQLKQQVHQMPLKYFPMVPELTTSMFWSHQKREYQNKHNTSLHSVSQDVSRQTTKGNHDNVPIPYERNGQRCDEPTAFSNQSTSQTQYFESMSTTGTGNQEHVDHNSGYHQYGHRASKANGYHSYPKLPNNNHRSVSSKRRTSAYRELVLKHSENRQIEDYHAQEEVIVPPVQENTLVNVDSLQGLGQDLKFDDEVWYINGVPHQHAKPLCPLNSQHVQYVVDVAPDGWSNNHGWSTGPDPNMRTSFTECQIDGRSNHQSYIHSNNEIDHSSAMVPPSSMQQLNVGALPYMDYNNVNNCNTFYWNNNNNAYTTIYSEADSTETCTSKSSAKNNKLPESELSPVSSLYSLSSPLNGDSSSEYGTESCKESSSSDTPVSWLEICDIFQSKVSDPRHPARRNIVRNKASRDNDPCDSSDSSNCVNNGKNKHRKGDSRKPRRTNCSEGKQIKVLSRRRSPVNTQRKKQKRQRKVETSKNTCLIKIV